MQIQLKGDLENVFNATSAGLDLLRTNIKTLGPGQAPEVEPRGTKPARQRRTAR